jgi:hypothetical protein
MTTARDTGQAANGQAANGQPGTERRERTFSWADPAAIAAAGAGMSGADFFAAIGAGTIPPPPVMRAGSSGIRIVCIW